MPTTNYNFEYESPNSTPGTTLTGGPGGGSPILAIQVDTALASVETKVDVNAANITANVGAIEASQAEITNLQNWTQRGSVNMSFSGVNASTTPVSFGFTFPALPTIMVNLDSGAGATARWEVRAISPTTTGFTMFAYQSQANTGTWTDIPLSWLAYYD